MIRRLVLRSSRSRPCRRGEMVMKKHPFILAGLLILAGIAGISRADTIVSVTETHYDTYLRPDCVAVRMNTATFADAASNACALKTAGTQGADRITKTVYDAAGQITQVIQAYGTANQRAYSTFSYSGNGKVIDTIDANGNRSHNVYDGFDRLITFYYPSTTRPTAFNASTQATALSTAGAFADATHGSDYEAFTYDNNGNRLTTRRRDGQILTDCYDALNRQIVHYVHSQSGCTATGGAKDVYTTYDVQGHILTKRFASTSGSGVSYAYDGRGRIASSTDMFNRTVSYQYNKADARTRLTDNEGYYVAYALDTLNRLTQATLNGTTDVLYGQTFNSLGQRTLLSRGASSAGGSTTYAYDNLSRLQGIAIDTAGTSYDVTWGKVGAVGSVAYNPAGQITNWGGSNTIFDYAEIAGSTDARTYDGLNRDSGVAALTGGYDARGNLTTDGTRTFTYDVENRLLTSTGGTNPLTLVYDPEGRLARVTSGSTTKDFLYDGVDLIAEYNSNGTVAARYIHGPGTDDPLVWLQGADDSDRRYYYTNYQGSLIGYTGSTGSFVTSSLTKYGAYGEPRNSNNVESWPASRFGYTGQVVLADAKLYYYKARVYDPVFGRFLQTDPIGSKDDLDLYAYVGGDPINKADPSGNCAEDLCIGEAAAVGWCVAGGCEAAFTATVNLIGVVATEITLHNQQHNNNNGSSNDRNSRKANNGNSGDGPNAPRGNNGNGPVHGGSKHNDAVDQDIQDMKDKGYTDIRKNQAQVDAQGNKVGNNRPDSQGTRPDGKREYREQDTDPNRSTQHGETIKRNDPSGICILSICIK